MRVALCYRGHYYREHLAYGPGQGSNFFLIYKNHVENVFNCFDKPDVYFHTYPTNSPADDELVELLNPVQYKLDSQPSREIRHSVICVNNMVDERNYDLIINLRFDLSFRKKITDFAIDYDKFNFLWKEGGYSPRKPLAYHRYSDLMWIFSSKYRKVLSDSYLSPCYNNLHRETLNRIRKDGHTIYYCMINHIDESEINIISSEKYPSMCDIPNPYVMINRSYE